MIHFQSTSLLTSLEKQWNIAKVHEPLNSRVTQLLLTPAFWLWSGPSPSHCDHLRSQSMVERSLYNSNFQTNKPLPIENKKDNSEWKGLSWQWNPWVEMKVSCQLKTKAILPPITTTIFSSTLKYRGNSFHFYPLRQGWGTSSLWATQGPWNHFAWPW